MMSVFFKAFLGEQYEELLVEYVWYPFDEVTVE